MWSYKSRSIVSRNNNIKSKLTLLKCEYKIEKFVRFFKLLTVKKSLDVEQELQKQTN